MISMRKTTKALRLHRLKAGEKSLKALKFLLTKSIIQLLLMINLQLGTNPDVKEA